MPYASPDASQHPHEIAFCRVCAALRRGIAGPKQQVTAEVQLFHPISADDGSRTPLNRPIRRKQQIRESFN